jgi:predicted transposase YbfD/YdcC
MMARLTVPSFNQSQIADRHARIIGRRQCQHPALRQRQGQPDRRHRRSNWHRANRSASSWSPLAINTSITAEVASAISVTAARAALAIRGHWRIETTSHYRRDVTFGEDRSRIRTNPGIFARLCSFAFNILKANRSNTLTQDRYGAALAGINSLLGLLDVSWR